MNRLSFLFLSLLMCLHIQAQKPTTFHVRLDKAFQGKVYLCCIKDRLTQVDSVEVNGSAFSISHSIDHPDEYTLVSRPFRFNTSVLAEPGVQYTITMEGSDGKVIQGGKEQARIDSLNSVLEPLNDSMQVISQKYSTLKEQGKDEEAEKWLEPNNALFTRAVDIKAKFIQSDPNSLAAMIVASELLSSDYPLLSRLHKVLSSSPYTYTRAWKRFDNDFRQVSAKWIQDKEAPDFITKDINGKVVRLSDFRGKTVLLDFWASWCLPCRAKMKKLKAIYPELTKQGITVVSISLDEDIEAWRKASREEGISWTNTCDVVPFNKNKIAQAYQISFIPQLFLISPQGFITSQSPDLNSLIKK